MSDKQDRLLIRISAQATKSFVLLLLGCGVALLLSFVFGFLPTAEVLGALLAPWLMRLGFVLLCLLATTTVIESLR
jgi:hypothetical protein